ncbi:type IV toxin-antitoxin system AbiEi family antitoxin domain-containing protein [Slackia heliotrinireducens]|uniref:type IV toxin-antitoxin system AbiEi family antitoxin domain-containing protein n=1 Tax=Slackia heliotrinireducens TaxID=84110 RepID=UPI003316266C
MIVTSGMLVEQYSSYANPNNKIARMVASGELTPIRRGLYETDGKTPGYRLASSVYGPSYLSFEYALSRHGLIPEAVVVYTSATCGKRRSKRYETPFGAFVYHDVPTNTFPLWIDLVREGEYRYWMASPEKAICDQLYRMPPVANIDELEQLLFQNLRIDEQSFFSLRPQAFTQVANACRCRNIEKLAAYVRRVLR